MELVTAEIAILGTLRQHPAGLDKGDLSKSVAITTNGRLQLSWAVVNDAMERLERAGSVVHPENDTVPLGVFVITDLGIALLHEAEEVHAMHARLLAPKKPGGKGTHTAGPWGVSGHQIRAVSGLGETVATYHLSRADGKLIAAAPEMLALLVYAVVLGRDSELVAKISAKLEELEITWENGTPIV